MRCGWIVLLLATALGMAAPVARAAMLQEPGPGAMRGVRIETIEVRVAEGDASLERLVREAMRTREGDFLSGDLMDADIQFLWQRYKIRIDRVDVTELGEKSVQLTYFVTKVPAFQRILFEGNEEFDREELLLQTNLSFAQAITRETVQQIIGDLEAYYRREGYHWVSVQPVFETNLSQIRMVIDEGPLVRVGDVSFVGNEAISSHNFLGIGLDLSGEVEEGDGFLFFPGSKFSDELVQRDLVALETLYRDYGYLDAEISIETLEFYSDNSRVEVTFRIREGALYTVRSVRLESDDPARPLRFSQERLMKLVKLEPGQPLERARIAADEAALRDFYGQRGHPAVATFQRGDPPESFWSFNPSGQPEFHFDLENDAVDVVYRIHEGRQMRLRDVVIHGNVQTKDRVIRRQVSLEPGDLANSEEALRSYRRLVGLNYFNDPDTRAPAVLWRFSETDREDWVDLEYDVTEGQTGRFLFGGGINTNTGPFISLNLQKDNFDITDLPSSFGNSFGEILGSQAFTGGGQTLRLFLAPGTEYSQYSLSWLEPDLFLEQIDRTSLSVQLFKTIFLLQTHDEDRNGVGFTVGRNFGRNFNLYVSPQTQRVTVSDLVPGAPVDLLEVEGANRMNSIRFGAGYNTVADPFNPVDGDTINVSYLQAGEFMGGNWDFNKIEFSAAKFFPLWQDSLDRYWVLAMSGSFYRGDQTGDLVTGLPFPERYFLGGQGTIRGFDFRGVGPRNQYGYPIGGDAAWYGTAELRFPLVSTRERGVVNEVEYVRGQVWSDLGSVGPNVSEIGLTRIAVGFGARIRIPFLPGMGIALDFGWPIQQQPYDDTRVFSFTFGNF